MPRARPQGPPGPRAGERARGAPSEEILELRAERERLRERHRAGAPGLEIVHALSDAVDELVRTVWGRTEHAPDTALVAVGGYGRRQMSPKSDVDLMVLHAGGRRSRGAREAATALFYALWDGGLVVGHSIRTPKEALALARGDFDAETAFLDARLVAGEESVFADFHQAALRRSRSDAKAFADRVRRAALARLIAAGDASSELEPNVKSGRGALRDLHAITWLRLVCGTEAPPLDAAAELLHRVRTELHFLTERYTDLLLRHLQPQVAAGLGWPPGDLDLEDELMRELYERCRTVAVTLDTMLEGPPRAVPVLQIASDRWTPGSRRAFLDLLAKGEEGRRAFHALERSGELERALPEWAGVRCLPQGNVYHRFPVDVHSFETVAAAAGLQSFQDDLVRRVAEETSPDRDALLLGALLHDVGKGDAEDHSVRGELLARRMVDRMGMPEPAASDVVWLVRHHLLLADTATRRDIDDESLVVETAENVGSLRRLRLLFLLTVADGLATGPAAWTPWKETLVADLFVKVARVLESGELVGTDASELARMRSADLRDALRRLPSAAVDGHLAGMPRQWLLSQSFEALIRQSALMIEPEETEPSLRATPSGDPRTWEVTVVARDRPGLLSKISGSLALHGLNVLHAQVYTRADGIALEVFRAESIDDDRDRFRRVADDAGRALRGEISIGDLLARKRSHYAPRTPKAVREPSVVVDDRASDFATVIDVHAPDRIGLLYEITDVLAELGLDLHLAKVATYAEEVVDVFYVRSLGGLKVGDRAAEIERALRDRLQGP